MDESIRVPKKINYILFDKDGTLLKLDKMLANWIKDVEEYLIVNKWSTRERLVEFLEVIGLQKKRLFLTALYL